MTIYELFLIAGMSALPAFALAAPGGHDHHHHQHHQMAQPEAVKAAAVTIDLRNEPVQDHDGRDLRFVDDVIGDKLVVLTVMYTSCTTVCPVTTALLSQVQGALGARQGKEVELISLTVDAPTDTPARLKAYAAKVGARPGWSWITGKKPAVNKILEGIDAWTADFTQHPSMVLVGDPQTKSWQRFYGFPSPHKIVAAVDQLQTARASKE